MPSWILKAIAQRVVGALPAPHFWNEILQTYISKSINLTDEKFFSRLDVARTHLEYYHAYAQPADSGLSIVELGTGWYPVVPIALWLCGADHVHTYDIIQHVTPARLSATLDKFVGSIESGILFDHLPAADRGRLQFLLSISQKAEAIAPQDFLRQINIDYIIEDIGSTTIPPQSVDLVISYSVLEYPSATAMASILETFKRILRPRGVTSHWISLADEYAYFDQSITPYNFLRFSSRSWGWINNNIIPLSRLRLTDFRSLFDQAGFCILEENVTRGEEADLAEVPLAPEFQAYPKQDLLAVNAWIVCTPAKSN